MFKFAISFFINIDTITHFYSMLFTTKRATAMKNCKTTVSLSSFFCTFICIPSGETWMKSDLGFHQEFYTRNFSTETILNCTDIFERRSERMIKWTRTGSNITLLNRFQIVVSSGKRRYQMQKRYINFKYSIQSAKCEYDRKIYEYDYIRNIPSPISI